jgi:ankyrin repeat protein
MGFAGAWNSGGCFVLRFQYMFARPRNHPFAFRAGGHLVYCGIMTEEAAGRGVFRGRAFRHCALVVLVLLASFAGAADLFDAAQRGDVALLKHLLARPSAQVNACNADGETPLLLAAREDRIEAAALLLDAGASLKAQDAEGLTPLHVAARYGFTDLTNLLCARKADLIARDAQGWTPLQWAIATDHLETAKALLARGAPVNVDDTAGATPLHWAAANGQLATLELLLAKGAAINLADYAGDTPLHWAAAAGQEAAARLLLARGANPALKDRQGRTPLQVATDEGQAALVALLRPANSPRAGDAALRIVAPDETPTLSPAAVMPSRRLSGKAQLTPVANPFAVQATALHAAGNKLYMGLADGGLIIYDASTRKGTALAPPVAARAVCAITAGDEGVWWLTARPAVLCGFREGAGTVTAYALDALRPGSPLADNAPTLSCWRGRVVVCTRDGAQALDPRSGEARSLISLLPAQLASAAKGARLFLAADDSATLLAAVRYQNKRWTATCWRSNGAEWASAGPRAVAEWCGVSACSPARLALLGNTLASDLAATAEKARTFEYRPRGARTPAPRWAAACGSTIWWGGGDVLYHAAPARGEVCAYLPWNDPGVIVRCATADEGGVWLATNHGVRRLEPGNPSPINGFAGFVRVRLGVETEQPITAADRMLAAAIEEWQGTPYRYGGASRNGTDCSGFVMAMHQVCGVSLPHGSAVLRVTPLGQVVRDELRYGDVLVFPGHAALYIGNGLTAETVSGKGVGKSTLWSRRSVVVRRFLNLPERPNIQLASRKGDRTTAAKRKAAAKKKH